MLVRHVVPIISWNILLQRYGIQHSFVSKADRLAHLHVTIDVSFQSFVTLIASVIMNVDIAFVLEVIFLKEKFFSNNFTFVVLDGRDEIVIVVVLVKIEPDWKVSSKVFVEIG